MTNASQNARQARSGPIESPRQAPARSTLTRHTDPSVSPRLPKRIENEHAIEQHHHERAVASTPCHTIPAMHDSTATTASEWSLAGSHTASRGRRTPSSTRFAE